MNGTSRVTLRRDWPQVARIEALENDADIHDEDMRAIRGDLRRIFWAVASLAATIIGALVVALVTK